MVGSLINGGILGEGGANDGAFLTTEDSRPIITEQA